MPRMTMQVGMMLLAWSSALLAQEGPVIEEIIVTAQRMEELSRKVPMSVSAFTDAMIEDRQIIGITDLQVKVPNLSYTQESFGGAKVVIRGIGDSTYDVISRGFVSPGVPVHWNGVSIPMRINVSEFFDVERLEVLRGPQGTLYGRNSNAGSINIITKMPDFDGFAGFLDLEYGDYDHKRAKAAVNLPLNDQFAVRVAGMWLDRDGYIDNKAADDIPDLDNHLDSRDLYNYRITGLWQPHEDINVWLMHGRFNEDDSRVTVHNTVCKTNDLPTQGCKADEFGLELPHQGSVFGMQVAGDAGAVPFGLRDAAAGLVYEFPRPALDLREQHTDVNPIFEFDEQAWLLGAQWTMGHFTLELAGSHFESEEHRLADRFLDVGYVMNPIPSNPSGLWPTSGDFGGIGGLRGGPCDLQSGQAGVTGGCTLNDDLNRLFTYAESFSEDNFWNAELRLRSDLAGRLNFLVGANWLDVERDLEVYRPSNAEDILGLFGYPLSGFTQFYPSFWLLVDEHATESYSAFGELYIDLTEKLKLTLGLRYNHDELNSAREVSQTEAMNLTPGPGGSLGSDPTWVRFAMLGYLGGNPDPYAVFLADQYGATEAIEAAGSFEDLVAALQIVPITEIPGEGADFAGVPGKKTFNETTLRIVLDWQVTDEALVYASFAEGYRPGGIFGLTIYEPETVDAYELGAKTRWLDGRLALDGALFFNDYQGLQLWSGGVADVVNIGAETFGAELELTWLPASVPGLAIDLGYAWLDAEYDSSRQRDSLDLVQGDTSVVALRNLGLDFVPFIAPVDEVLPWVDTAMAIGAARSAPGAFHDNGIPVYFSRGFLDAVGVATSNGNLVDIGGNTLANSPPHSVTLGLAQTWSLATGSLTLRYDFYWQDDSYGREFNTAGDKIDSWSTHNASLIFESGRGRWSARAWIRNIADKNIVTGHYVENAASGGFRNYFLAEPRIFGASFRYNFGQVQ